MKYKLLVAAAAGLLLLAATPVAASDEPSVTVTLDVTKDTPVVCAADLLDTLNKGNAGTKPDHTVLEQYVVAAKLTAEQQTALARDCIMFNYGAQFSALLLKQAEVTDEAGKEVPALPPGVADTSLKK